MDISHADIYLRMLFSCKDITEIVTRHLLLPRYRKLMSVGLYAAAVIM